MVVNESGYKQKLVWKRRLRNAPSAQASDFEIHLTVLWNPVGAKYHPTQTDVKDPLLWSIWQLRSGMVFKVSSGYKSGIAAGEALYFSDKKEALAEYKKRVKEFPRSKEIDYGFPVDEAT